jgi:hypothetical protein
MKLLKLTLMIVLAVLVALLLSPWRDRVLGTFGIDIHWHR